MGSRNRPLCYYASLHALIDENTTQTEVEEIKKELRHILHHHAVVHSTIELEYVPCDQMHCHAQDCCARKAPST